MTMTDTPTNTPSENGETVATRNRYKGDVTITTVESEIVNVSDIGVGRPRIDLSEYETALKSNLANNRKLARENKEAYDKGARHAWTFTVETDAVSVAKSRVNAAAKEVGCGTSFGYSDLGNGFTKVSVVANPQRATNRGRKPQK